MVARLVTVSTFETPFQANLAQNALEAAGIQAFVHDENVAGMNWALTNAIGGVKLQVSSNDLQVARKVLNDTSPAEFPEEYEVFDDGFGNAPSSQQVDDNDDYDKPLTPMEEAANRAFFGAVFGLLFLPLQLYVSWLLLQIFFSDESLRPKQRRRLLIATAINLPCVLILLVLAKILIHSP